MSKYMLKKLLFAVKRRRKVNHSKCRVGYSGIEEQSRLMDGWRKEERNKETNSDDGGGGEEAFLPHSSSERARLLARSGPPFFLASTHSFSLLASLRSFCCCLSGGIFRRRTFGFRHITRCTTPLTVRRKEILQTVQLLTLLTKINKFQESWVLIKKEGNSRL